VPIAVDELIQKACAKDRAQRFQSCEELIAAIDHLAVRPARTRTLPDSPLSPIETPDHGSAAAATSDEHPHARSRAGTTGQGAEIAATTGAPAKGRGGFVAALAIVVLAGGALGASALGLVPGVILGSSPPRKPITNRDGAHPSASATTSAAPPPVPPAKSGIELLEGPWIVNGKDLDAVLVGDVLEFRVRTPSQFERQGYLAGEARFTLRDTDEPEVYAATADLHEHFSPGNPDWGHPPVEDEVRATSHGWGPPNEDRDGLFGETVVRWYQTVQHFDGEGFADLLRTLSPYRRLDASVREPLLNAIAQRIRTTLDDHATRHYLTVLRAGQRTH